MESIKPSTRPVVFRSYPAKLLAAFVAGLTLGNVGFAHAAPVVVPPALFSGSAETVIYQRPDDHSSLLLRWPVSETLTN